MEHKLKLLAEAAEGHNLKSLITSHVKELALENGHLIVYVDNAAPLHELSEKGMDEQLRKALEKIFDPSITYELRLHKNTQVIDHNLNRPPQRNSH